MLPAVMRLNLAESGARLKEVTEAELPDQMPPNTRLAKTDFHTQPCLLEAELLSELSPQAGTDVALPMHLPFGLTQHSKEQIDTRIADTRGGDVMFIFGNDSPTEDVKKNKLSSFPMTQHAQGVNESPSENVKQSRLQAAQGMGAPSSVERELASLGFGLSGFKTAMLKHVPLAWRQAQMLEVVNKSGFEGTFDFFYLPAHIKDGNRGFAFVNFLRAEYAEEFYNKFNGNFDLFGVGNKQEQPLTVMPAIVQGLRANVNNLMLHRHRHSWQEPPIILNASAVELAEFIEIVSAVPATTPAKLLQRKLPKATDKADREWKQRNVAVKEPVIPGIPLQKQRPRTKAFCEFCGSARSSDHIFCAYCGESFR